MKILTSETKDLKRIESDIKRARAWLECRFNRPKSLMTIEVTYPDVDRALVVPGLLGRSFGEKFGGKYRLVWKNGKVFWRGGPVLRPDIIIDLEVTDELS